MGFSVVVQEVDFDVGDEYQKLIGQDTDAGAVVFFVGRMRDFNQAQSVSGLYLEHYPGMTENVLETLVQQAREKWDLLAVTIIHRVGHFKPGDQIVFVAATSSHRESAFQAVEFLMDFLKTRAPFWKKETAANTATGVWLDAQEKDEQAADRWKS